MKKIKPIECPIEYYRLTGYIRLYKVLLLTAASAEMILILRSPVPFYLQCRPCKGYRGRGGDSIRRAKICRKIFYYKVLISINFVAFHGIWITLSILQLIHNDIGYTTENFLIKSPIKVVRRRQPDCATARDRDHFP